MVSVASSARRQFPSRLWDPGHSKSCIWEDAVEATIPGLVPILTRGWVVSMRVMRTSKELCHPGWRKGSSENPAPCPGHRFQSDLGALDGGELTISAPWENGKEMTCTDHLLFCGVLSWILVRVMLSQQKEYVLNECLLCARHCNKYFSSVSVFVLPMLGTVYHSPPLGESSLRWPFYR